MLEGVVKGSWTPCLKAKVGGGREAPQHPKVKVEPIELCSMPVSLKAEVCTAIDGDRQKRWGALSGLPCLTTRCKRVRRRSRHQQGIGPANIA